MLLQHLPNTCTAMLVGDFAFLIWSRQKKKKCKQSRRKEDKEEGGEDASETAWPGLNN